MAFNGIEIEMLSLGDADSLLVTLWENGRPTHILIDGGYAKDAATVTRFLQGRGIRDRPPGVLHMDNDHAAGLLRLVQEGKFEIDCGWVHRPDLHVDRNTVKGTMRKATAFKEARIITNSLSRQMGLAAELIGQGVDVIEPFEGQETGLRTSCPRTVSIFPFERPGCRQGYRSACGANLDRSCRVYTPASRIWTVVHRPMRR